jgi:hypothetical protein
MYQPLAACLNLPEELISKIYYLSVPSHPCKKNLCETYRSAVEYKEEIDTIYKDEDIFPFPGGTISKAILIYLSQMLLSDNRPHSYHIDPDTFTSFIFFYENID